MERKTGITLGLCALVGAAVLLWIAGGFAIASEAVYPVERSATWFGRNVSCRLRTLWRRQGYAAENVRLRREVAMLRMSLAEAERNAGIGSGTSGAAPAGWIPAPVLSRNGVAGAKNFLRIGKGSRHGVEKGSAVASPDGLVGIVDEVSPHTCTVKMVTDPSVKVSCVVETGDPALGAVYGIVSGTGAAKVAEGGATVLYVVNPLRLGHLKSGFRPAPRTRVYTSGLGGVFPKGILVGHMISDVRSDSTKLEMECDIAPAVDFPALEEVFIRDEG